MKKIMFVNYTMNIGGIETFLLNVCQNLDMKKYKVYFLCYNKSKFDFEDELINLGCEFIKINPPSKISIKKHFKEVFDTIKEKKINIVHSNTYFNSGIVMLAASKAGCSIRITHSHTTQGLYPPSFFSNIKWKIGRYLINKYSNFNISCSKEAGKALFGHNKFEVINNGIDFSKFKYNPKSRKIIRGLYHIKESDVVIGHVGRIEIYKNQKFLIDILKELDEKYKLILVGNGKMLEELKRYSVDNNLKNRVFFTGNIMNTYDYYNSFDIFAFPSIYEGLGISLIEAEANGLQCLASVNVPKESNINGKVKYLELTKSLWIKKINKINPKRINNFNQILKSDYSIINTVNDLINIYDN